MGVDGVVDDCPANGGGVERQTDGPVAVAVDGRVADQGAPVERQSENQLRPIRHPFHQRITHHQTSCQNFSIFYFSFFFTLRKKNSFVH